ncbi:GSCOCG00002522001-RA-CDS [Cotesia congregata]|nr:GSCOCG00002522001-RA-CDS [Cotesia congregata]
MEHFTSLMDASQRQSTMVQQPKKLFWITLLKFANNTWLVILEKFILQ